MAAVYVIALLQGPAGFYTDGIISEPSGGVPSVAWIFVYALVANVIWWGILFVPSRPRRPTTTGFVAEVTS
ncbi:MAG: hypothetical protein ACT4OI_08275 [Methanobacteriota archaeon]